METSVQIIRIPNSCYSPGMIVGREGQDEMHPRLGACIAVVIGNAVAMLDRWEAMRAASALIEKACDA